MARSHKARPVCVADFETTTDPDDCRVWGWGFADVSDPETVTVDTTIELFIGFISDISRIVYFHNLRFDGHFIIDWLLKNGYEHVEDGKTSPGTFKSLISDMGFFYSVTVHWESGAITEFRDSMKKLPMSVSRVAKSFGYEESKGEIDYHTHRPVGHKITLEEHDYIRRDVSIIAKAIKQVHVDNGMRRLTVASDSLAEYKSLKDVKFPATFPTLSTDADAEVRRAYRGGYTYADERFRGREVGSGIVLDVNSLYPHIMTSRLMPFGESRFFESFEAPTKQRPLTIFSVTFTARLREGFIPCIQIKGSSRFNPTEYVRVIDEPVSLMVTNVDWELYNDHYHIEVISMDGGHAFMGTGGLFDSYVHKWSKIKEHSSHGIREIAKLHLNSLYGKFASNPNVTSKVPYLEDGRVKFRSGDPETRDPVYTAAGVFITSWARDLTIRAAQSNYNVFAYADTDSLHLLMDEPPNNLDIHPSRMGAWKVEYTFKRAFYIRSKAYLEQKHSGEYVNRIAGLPLHLSEKLTIEDLKPGLVIDGKLTPRSVPGGVVLQETKYELKLE